jgi:hypothetical protein
VFGADQPSCLPKLFYQPMEQPKEKMEQFEQAEIFFANTKADLTNLASPRADNNNEGDDDNEWHDMLKEEIESESIRKTHLHDCTCSLVNVQKVLDSL